MGNQHGTWSPETSSRGWTRHSHERYTQLSVCRSRSRSVLRRASRRRAFMETIEEEWQISEDDTQEEQHVLQDAESHLLAQVPAETVPAPGEAQHMVSMEGKATEDQAKMKRTQEAKTDGREQLCLVTSPLVEDPMLPYGGARRKVKSSKEKKDSYYFCNRTSNMEQAKLVKVTVWDVDDDTLEGQTIIELDELPFECRGRDFKEEATAAAEHGIDALCCEVEAMQSGNADKADHSQGTNEGPHLQHIPRESPQSGMTAGEVEDRV